VNGDAEWLHHRSLERTNIARHRKQNLLRQHHMGRETTVEIHPRITGVGADVTPTSIAGVTNGRLTDSDMEGFDLGQKTPANPRDACGPL
jgi:hypothetical protein